MKVKNKICFGIFTAGCLIAIIVCAICGLAIKTNFAWSPIAISSVIFGWLILSPMILRPRKGFYISSIILSILIVPFLYILSILSGIKEVFFVGWIMAIIGVVYFWSVIGICHKSSKKPYLAAGLSVLLAAPICLVINLILAKMFPQPDENMPEYALSMIILLAISGALFLAQYIKSSKTQREQ